MRSWPNRKEPRTAAHRRTPPTAPTTIRGEVARTPSVGSHRRLRPWQTTTRATTAQVDPASTSVGPTALGSADAPIDDEPTRASDTYHAIPADAAPLDLTGTPPDRSVLLARRNHTSCLRRRASSAWPRRSMPRRRGHQRGRVTDLTTQHIDGRKPARSASIRDHPAWRRFPQAADRTLRRSRRCTIHVKAGTADAPACCPRPMC